MVSREFLPRIYAGLFIYAYEGWIYMRSYLLKASDEDMDRWRAAAESCGLSLAAFLRRAANAHALVPVEVLYDGIGREAGVRLGLPEKPFKSDFKGRR